MWDPVENVSFVPWVFTAALVHGLMVQATKKKWTIANLLLSGLPFLLFAYGTFLTRSGLLSETSVHSFANMNRSALKLLGGFLVISAITFFALLTWRWLQYRKTVQPDPEPGQYKGLHREGFFRLGAWLLAGLGIAAALGMSWPAIMAASGKASKVVEEPLYHSTMSWLYVPLMLAMAIAPMVAWRGMGAKAFANRLFGVLCVSVAAVGVIMMLAARSPWIHSLGEDAYIKMPFGYHVPSLTWVLILTSLSVLVIVSNLWRVSELIKRSKLSSAAFLTHVGVAVLMAGLITSRGLEKKEKIEVREGSHAVGLGYFVTYDKMTSDVYDRNNKVLFTMVRGDEKWTAKPGLYYVEGEDGPRPMVWPHIKSTPFYDIYFALQPPTNEISAPIQIRPGETKDLNGAMVTYENLVREGTPGAAGMKWGAKLKFGSGKVSKTVTPMMELTEHGTIDHSVEVDSDVRVSMLAMNAGTNAVTIQLLSSHPIYPVEMFYKPLTILVWLGTAIMALAGLLSAFHRRMPRTLRSKMEADAAPASQSEAPKKPGKKAAAVGAGVH
jgi:cytochrome c-type biogenesis protein CcmF